MRITALLENTTELSDMNVEHGLSLYIETANHKILFDMGQTAAFADNAKLLGIDLANVDIAILSHGHYDHGGGLAKFLEVNKKAPIFAHRDAFLPHYNGTRKYIGLDMSLSDEPRIIFTDGEQVIDEGLTIMTCNGYEKIKDFGSFGLTERKGDSFIDDDFRHEQYLLINENGKRTLISGCSHKGIINLCEWLKPDALVGGFHFSKMALDSLLVEAARKLDSYATDFYTCHCTGAEQYEFMRKYMRRLNYLPCGKNIEI